MVLGSIAQLRWIGTAEIVSFDIFIEQFAGKLGFRTTRCCDNTQGDSA